MPSDLKINSQEALKAAINSLGRTYLQNLNSLVGQLYRLFGAKHAAHELLAKKMEAFDGVVASDSNNLMTQKAMLTWLADQLPDLTNVRGELLDGIIKIFKDTEIRKPQRFHLRGDTNKEMLQNLSVDLKKSIETQADAPHQTTETTFEMLGSPPPQLNH